VKITSEDLVGRRVRKTLHYPARGDFLPAVSYTYEGRIARVRDVAADIRQAGRYPDFEARRHEGEFHVTLADVTVTQNPASPFAHEPRPEVVLLGHEDGWELA
jgi:hypothetical protein